MKDSTQQHLESSSPVFHFLDPLLSEHRGVPRSGSEGQRLRGARALGEAAEWGGGVLAMRGAVGPSRGVERPEWGVEEELRDGEENKAQDSGSNLVT